MIRTSRCLLLILAVFVFSAAPSAADTRVVTSNADTLTTGTLRTAINDANSGACVVPCTITFATPMTINTSGGLVISAPGVIIDGFSVGTPNTNAFPGPDNATRGVDLAGPSTTCGCTGIIVNGPGVTVRGLTMFSFDTAISLGDQSAAVTGNFIRGNLRGVVVDGSTAMQNRIGGGLPDERNIISGNSFTGINIRNLATQTLIIGNFIGTNPTGTAAFANGTGILVASNTGDTAVGVTSGIGNLIAGNFAGIDSGAGFTRVHNNLIGTSSFGNSVVGVRFTDGTSSMVTDNLIARNGKGVEIVEPATAVTVQNNVFEATGQGIDLAAASGFELGPTLNDTGDGDIGGNHLQNYPDISEAALLGGTDTLRVGFTVDSSTRTPTNGFVLELYEWISASMSTRFIGAQCFDGRTPVGPTTFSSTGLLPNSEIMMTATSYAENCPVATVTDGTSEFSPPFLVTVLPGVVVNTADSGPGSLRQAILDMNATTCLRGGCFITFAIPLTDPGFDGSVFTIQPATPLPRITQSNLYVDGTTQTSFTGDTNPAGPEIVINGALAGGNGLEIGPPTVSGPAVSFVTIDSLVINGFSGAGIDIIGFATATSSSHSIINCFIGTDKSGTAAVPNGTGVLISGSSGANVIGGTGPNLIAFNSGAGVGVLSPALENEIRGNSIHSNGALGIDLGMDGVTANDPNDIDTGANALQNFPVLTSVTPSGSDTFVAGTLQSEPLFNFDLDFYTSAAPDPSGHGEGQTYLISQRVTTDAAGNASFSAAIPGIHRWISATASRVTTSSALETSEFSAVFNNPPVAVDDTASPVPSGTPASVDVLANDSDPDGDTFAITAFTNGSFGTVSCSGSICTYTPNPGFAGTDSFTYTISDPAGATATATVFVTILNQAPVAVADAYSTNEDVPLVVIAPGVLANDTDAEGNPLTAVLVSGPANGTLALNPDGSFTYTPNPNFNGTDSFTYQASDGTALSAVTTVTIAVAPVNDPPVAVDDNATAFQGEPVITNVLANDSDPEGDPLTVSSFTQGSQGSVSCTPAGNCTYTPNAGASGSDSYTYTISDGNGGFATATVLVTIVLSCPTAPDVVSPPSGATGVPTAGQLEFAGDAPFFEVFYGPAGQGCSMSQAFTAGRFVTYGGLQPDTEYEWRVEAHRDGCPPVSSPCVSFRTLRTCSTAPPTPLTPAAGATAASPITFSWMGVPGASGYTVFAMTGAPTDVNLGSTTNTSLQASLPDGAGSWYVVAHDVPGCGDLRSTAVSFTICNAPEAPLAAVVGESTSGQTYSVIWNEVPGATRYEVLEANNAGFAGAQSFTTEALFFSFTKEAPTNAVPFFYQVRAFSDCFNGFGAASPTIRVVIVPIPTGEQPNINASVPAGSNQTVILKVFIPGEPGQTFRYTATTDQEWMIVRPETGLLPPEGVTLEVVADPRGLPNGTFTGTVILTLSDLAGGRATTDSNHTKQTTVSINLVTPVVPISPGPPVASSLIIPAVGHLDGADAKWRSDIRIANTGGSLAKYLLTFTPGNPTQGVKQTSIDVAPGATTALDDIVRAWYGIGSLGESSNGVLEVRPLSGGSNLTTKGGPDVSLTTVVSSRTYAQTLNGTLGEFIPGISFGRFVGLAGEGQTQSILNLQQIAQNQLYRTNVGVVEASGKPVSTVLSIFNSAGDKLTDVNVDLKANEQRQINALLAEHGITLADGRIEVRVTGGDGRITAYAAVIDNRTRDQLFVPASTLGQFTSARYVMPGIADLNTGSALWRSDMHLFNSGPAAQNATLTFYPLNHTSGPLTASLTVQPGEVKVLDNVVQSLFDTANIGGAVHVDTPDVSSLVVTARTYNQTTNGTLGLFIPAVTPDEAIGTGGRALHLLQAEHSVRYRTNVGIAEVTGKAATVELFVHLPDSKVTPRIEIPMAANEFKQIPILQALGIGNVYNARLSMRVVNGEGKITAYGSVIDMKTQDSTYVPAQ